MRPGSLRSTAAPRHRSVLRALLLAAILALVLGPPVTAAPIASGSTFTAYGSWSYGSVWGTCYHELVTLSAVQVNSRLLVDLQSSIYGLGGGTNPTSDVDCALPAIVHAGVFVNPCHVFRGDLAAPVVNPVDPYLTLVGSSYSQDTWAKSIHFPDGSRANYYVYTSDRYDWLGFSIECWAGTLSGRIGGSGDRVAVP